MNEIARLFAVIGADTSGLQKGLGEAQGALGQAKRGMSGLGIAAAGIAVAGVGALVGGLVTSVQEAMAAQEGISQLEAVIQSTGGKAGVTKNQVLELADSIQKTTKFADDDVIAASNMLLTFTNIGKDVFPQTTRAAFDMAQALGMDGKQAAMMLGKALNDPIQGVTALRRVGVQLSDAQEAQIKKFMAVNDIASAQKVILGELGTEFGGSAEAAGNTFAGKLAIAGHALDDVKEKIGNAVLPILAEGAQKFSEFLTSPELDAFTSKVAGAFGTATTFISSLVGGLAAGGDPFSVVTKSVFNLLTALGMGPTEAANWAMSIGNFVGQAVALFQQVVGWVQANWPAVRDTIVGIFNQAVAIITPIVNSMISIVQTVLGAIQGFIAEHGAEIQAFFQSAWTRVQGIISGVMDVLNATIVPMWQAIANFISQNQDTIKAAIELVWNGIKTVIGTVLTVIETVIKTAMKIINGDWAGAWEELKKGAETVWDGIKAFFDNIPTKLKQIGEDVINAIVEGIKSAASAVQNALQNVINGAIDAIKKMLGIPTGGGSGNGGLGSALVGSLVDSMNNGQSAVRSAAMALARAAEIPFIGYGMGMARGGQAEQTSAAANNSASGNGGFPTTATIYIDLGDTVERRITNIVYAAARGV